MIRQAGRRYPSDNSPRLRNVWSLAVSGSRTCAALRRRSPSSRDDAARSVLLSKSCRLTDDRLCGAGERTAPSTGHHTSPEFVREITSPALVVSAQGHSGSFGPKPPIRPPVEPSRPASRDRPAPARIHGTTQWGGEAKKCQQTFVRSVRCYCGLESRRSAANRLRFARCWSR